MTPREMNGFYILFSLDATVDWFGPYESKEAAEGKFSMLTYQYPLASVSIREFRNGKEVLKLGSKSKVIPIHKDEK